VTASNRWLMIVAGAIVIAVVVGIAVTMLAGGERKYAEGTPERTVQDYLRAVSDRDATLAMTFLTTDAAKQCDAASRRGISDRGSNTIRATLDRALVRADTAEVRVRLTESYGNDSPFSSGQSSNNQTFTLKQTDGTWRLTDSPWPLYCPAPTPPR